jgi:acetate kinase
MARVKILVVKANEEKIIAEDTYKICSDMATK